MRESRLRWLTERAPYQDLPSQFLFDGQSHCFLLKLRGQQMDSLIPMRCAPWRTIRGKEEGTHTHTHKYIHTYIHT